MSLTFLLTSALLQPLQLEVAPVGWSDLKYLFQRDEVYKGVMLTGTADLTFWKTGAQYLRTLYAGGIDANGQLIPAQGVDASAVLNVYETDPNEYRTALVLRQQVDFTTYRNTQAGVQVKLKETGLATNLLARADSEVDLFGSISLGGGYLAPLQPTVIDLHSQMLRLKYAASQSSDGDLSPGNMFGDEDNPSREQLLYFGFNKPEQNDLGLQAVGGGFVAGDKDTVVEIYKCKENGPVTVDYNLHTLINATNNGQGPEFETVEGDGFLRFVHVNGTFRDIPIIPSFYVGNLGGDYIGEINTGSQSFTEYCEIGDKILLYARYYIHDVGGLGTGIRYRSVITARMLEGSYLRITVDSTTPASNCRGVLVHEALQRLTEAMTDQPGGFYSEYFGRVDSLPGYAMDGPGSRRLLINGFGIRQFPLPQDAYPVGTDGVDPRKALTASFSSVYNSLDSIDCLGAGLEQRNGKPTLRIEHRSYFYQNKEVLRLGRVQGLAEGPYLPALHNQVHIGYQHWQSGTATGLDEFNGQRTYALPLVSIKATYSALSEVNAAGQLIETTRRQPFASGTNAEGKADQELFVISLSRAPGGSLVTEKNEAFSLVTGTLSPDTAYNLRLTPGRNLRRHASFIRAGLVPYADRKLLLTVVEGNDKLVTQLRTEAAPIEEHADLLISDLTAPIYQADTHEFTTKLRRHQLRQLVKNPYGKISFLDRGGVRRSGYLSKVECAPESGKASFTLLRA